MDSMTIAILFLILGVILLVAEALVPGFGILGIAGIASVVVAIVIYADSVLQTVIFLAVFVALLGIGFFILTRVLQVNRLVLKDQEEPDRGYTAFRPDAGLVGKTGVTQTNLHPTGAALVDGKRLDVISRGEYIKKGQKIRIMDVQGMRILVQLEEV